ncbi:MAG TPA: serine/threonine-protein kinase [Candidatus Saccharimonadales bacterium]|nr:serine/threonine-protein kinase [Candidatus Saccharimonadales bacterium]
MASAVATPELTAFPIPTDRYEVLEPIRTGMSLFKARAYDHENDQQVFIKAEKPESENAASRLMREADIYESLDHPQVPRLLDSVRNDDFAYIATEFMPGSRSLPNRLKARGPKPVLVARLCLSALEVLDYVHAQGFVHRDVKTPNFLMQTAGVASLADFGIARHMDSGDDIEKTAEADVRRRIADTAITHSSDFAGTPSYTSPEQLMGVKVSAQSDVYGVGTMLHELLDGQLPFLSAGETTIRGNELASRKFLPHEGHFWQNQRVIPGALKFIVLRALEPNLANRYASAAEMGEDLRRYLASACRAPRTYSGRQQTGENITPTDTATTQKISGIVLQPA